MHTSSRLRELLLLLVMLSLSSQCADGKARATNNKPVAGLKALPAHLDPSVLPIPILKADAAINVVLPAKAVRTLIGKQQAQTFRMDLAKNDSVTNVPPLQGRVFEEEPYSIITTIEHGVKPQFYFGLFALMPRYAPDLARQMEAQIAQSKLKLAAQVSKQEKLMQAELKARPPVPVIPGAVQKASPDPSKPFKLQLADSKLKPRIPIPDVVHRPTPELTKQLDLQLAQAKDPARLPKLPLVAHAVPPSNFAEQIQSQLAQSQKQTRTQIETANQHLQAELASAKQPKGRIPNPIQPASPSTAAALQAPETHLKVSLPKPADEVAAKMRTQLVAAKLKVPPKTDVDAQLLQAKKHSEEVSAKLKPQMDALVTSLRLAPDRSHAKPISGASVSTTAEIVGSKVILWDKWHLHFAELAHVPLLPAVQKCSNPTGANTVSITVSDNHHVEVSVASTKNPVFDQAVLTAYRSLDGNPELQFPAGSQRKSISFLVDVTHSASGSPSEVRSRTSKGDKETLRLGH